MSPTATQRPVPIRPSPAKCLVTSSKQMLCFGVNTTISSPSTLTPPRTGVKRKQEDDDDDFGNLSSPENVKCKRRINFAQNSNSNCQLSHPPVAVQRRNARERNRVKQVNNGFATLRQHIPGAAKAKKISKVETLKQAVDYIRSLQCLLDENDYGSAPPMNNSTHGGQQQQQQHNSVPVTSYDYSTNPLVPMNTTFAPTKMPQYPTYYYSENVSPLCTSVYQISTTSQHSPACSDGATSSPSPSYISDSSSHLGSVEPGPITVLPDDINTTLFLTADTFAGNFGMQYLDRLEEEDFIENCIESWESK